VNASMNTRLLCAVILFPALAFASIGTVGTLQGQAQRTPKEGKPVALTQGAAIELGDTLEVQSGALQLVLGDGSTLMVAQGSKVVIDEATFAPMERRFSARLLLGSLWASVTKTLEGSHSSFEVSTERAVAGVRGTVFRVDVDSSKADDPQTEVSVEEGQVAVRPRTGGAAEELLKAGERLRVLRDRVQRVLATRAEGAFEEFVREHRREALERRERLRERIERRRNR
jgi:hypothetical protein